VFKLGRKKLTADGRLAGAVNLPYFVPPPELVDIVGEQPTEIRILFPVASERLLFPHDMNKWSTGNMLTFRCDGRISHTLPRDGQEAWAECQWTNREQACPCGAKAEGRLNFLVLDKEQRGYGPYQVSIRGTQRVADILGFLVFHVGYLGPLFTRTAFVLKRVPGEMTYTGADGKRHTGPNYPVSLALEGPLTTQAALPSGIEPKAITATVERGPESDEVEEDHVEADPTPEPADEAPPIDLTGRVVELPDPDAPSTPAEVRAFGPDWTHEEVAALAKQMGIAYVTFQSYIQARFGSDFDNLGGGSLRTLGTEMTEADAKGPVAVATFKAGMFVTMKAAAQRAGKAGRR
jgi:hypothetical protein